MNRRRSTRESNRITSRQHPSPSTADQLTKLAELRDKGVITPEEFEREKAKVLT